MCSVAELRAAGLRRTAVEARLHANERAIVDGITVAREGAARSICPRGQWRWCCRWRRRPESRVEGRDRVLKSAQAGQYIGHRGHLLTHACKLVQQGERAACVA